MGIDATHFVLLGVEVARSAVTSWHDTFAEYVEDHVPRKYENIQFVDVGEGGDRVYLGTILAVADENEGFRNRKIGLAYTTMAELHDVKANLDDIFRNKGYDLNDPIFETDTGLFTFTQYM